MAAMASSFVVPTAFGNQKIDPRLPTPESPPPQPTFQRFVPLDGFGDNWDLSQIRLAKEDTREGLDPGHAVKTQRELDVFGGRGKEGGQLVQVKEEKKIKEEVTTPKLPSLSLAVCELNSNTSAEKPISKTRFKPIRTAVTATATIGDIVSKASETAMALKAEDSNAPCRQTPTGPRDDRFRHERRPYDSYIPPPKSTPTPTSSTFRGRSRSRSPRRRRSDSPGPRSSTDRYAPSQKHRSSTTSRSKPRDRSKSPTRRASSTTVDPCTNMNCVMSMTNLLGKLEGLSKSAQKLEEERDRLRKSNEDFRKSTNIEIAGLKKEMILQQLRADSNYKCLATSKREQAGAQAKLTSLMKELQQKTKEASEVEERSKDLVEKLEKKERELKENKAKTLNLMKRIEEDTNAKEKLTAEVKKLKGLLKSASQSSGPQDASTGNISLQGVVQEAMSRVRTVMEQRSGTAVDATLLQMLEVAILQTLQALSAAMVVSTTTAETTTATSAQHAPSGPPARRIIDIRALLRPFLANTAMIGPEELACHIPEKPRTATEAFVILFLKYATTLAASDVGDYTRLLIRPFNEIPYEQIAPHFNLIPGMGARDIQELQINRCALPSTTFERITYDLNSAKTLYGDSVFISATESSRLMESLFREIVVLFKGVVKHRTGNPGFLPQISPNSPYHLHRFVYKEVYTPVIIVHFFQPLATPKEGLPVFLAHAAACSYSNSKFVPPHIPPTPVMGIITDTRTFTFCFYNPLANPATETITWATDVASLSSFRTDTPEMQSKRIEGCVEYLFDAFLLALYFITLAEGKDTSDIWLALNKFHTAGIIIDEARKEEREGMVSEGLSALDKAVALAQTEIPVPTVELPPTSLLPGRNGVGKIMGSTTNSAVTFKVPPKVLKRQAVAAAGGGVDGEVGKVVKRLKL